MFNTYYLFIPRSFKLSWWSSAVTVSITRVVAVARAAAVAAPDTHAAADADGPAHPQTALV